MADLAAWIAVAEREALPAPVIAGLAHYQFVTIHPFFDGNGRTARALATWILYKHGYDLGRFHSLEEAYAANLAAYCAGLQTHPHHNYHEGRADADLTGWLACFLDAMAASFDAEHTPISSWRSPMGRRPARRGRRNAGVHVRLGQRGELRAAAGRVVACTR